MAPETTSIRMPQKFRAAPLTIAGLLISGAAFTLAWQYELLPERKPHSRENSIMVIVPYRHQGTWVFDDSSTGLVKEPFVAGVPEMIDALVKNIPAADKGFRLLFAANPFPDYQKELRWLRGDHGGNYYAMDEPRMEGWICPAMFKYYNNAPARLYVKAESIPQ